MIDWLNDNSGAVQGLAAAASLIVLAGLAVVTWWYAKQTKRIAAATEEQRLEGLRPVLDVGYRFYDSKVGNAPALEVGARNIGPGPALAVECFFEHPRFAYDALWWSAVGARDVGSLQRLVRRAGDDRSEASAGVGTLAAIVLRYEDVFRRLFETRVTFEQNELGLTVRSMRYTLVADRALEDRGPPSGVAWREFKVSSSGSMEEITHDP